MPDVPAHHCHALGCDTRCKPEFLMCPNHWRMVPFKLQRLVWAHYRPGQCDDKRPSAEWMQAADAAIAAVALKEGRPVPVRWMHAYQALTASKPT